jgi:hypothetical protein
MYARAAVRWLCGLGFGGMVVHPLMAAFYCVLELGYMITYNLIGNLSVFSFI